MNDYKYMSWTDGQFFSGNKLLSSQQRKVVLNGLLQKPTSFNIYQTIQSYNPDTTNSECPIYADFDGLGALEDTRDYVKTLEELGADPLVFFSGNKGFHVVLPYMISGDNCANVVRYMIKRLGEWQTLDKKVYGNRRLWRIEGTYNTNGGYYKTRIHRDELAWLELEDIKVLCKNKPALTMEIPECTNECNDKLSKIEEIAREELAKVVETTEVSSTYGDWMHHLTPCVTHFLNNPPDEGDWNQTVFILARFFKRFNVSVNEALSIMYARPFYADDHKHVDKVFRSTYERDGLAYFGCGDNPDSEIMLRYCDKICPYNKETLWFGLE